MQRILVELSHYVNGYKRFIFTDIGQIEPYFEGLETKEHGTLKGVFADGWKGNLHFNNMDLTGTYEFAFDTQVVSGFTFKG